MKTYLHNVIKPVLIIGFLVLFLFAACAPNTEDVYGDDMVVMHFFHLWTCPHCHDQKEFHEVLTQTYPSLKIIEYEISEADSRDEYLRFSQQFTEMQATPRTPTTVIGDRVNIGFISPETSGRILDSMIRDELARIRSGWTSDMKTTVELRQQ